jgi:hypothetical protein
MSSSSSTTIRKCSENDYGTLYELFPSIHYTIYDTNLPFGLETHYNKKHLNWTCSDDDAYALIERLSKLSKALYRTIQATTTGGAGNGDIMMVPMSSDTIPMRPGIRSGQSGYPCIIETQPYPRMTSHKLFIHEKGEILTFNALVPGFSAKEIQVECKNIWVNKQGCEAKALWYTSRVRPAK